MRIRKAQEKDIKSLYEIHVKAIQNIGPEFYNDSQKIAWLKSKTPEGYISRLLDTYVLIDGNKLIGFLEISKSSIKRLFIDPEIQGKGFGSKLMKFGLNKIYKDNKNTKVKLTATLNSSTFYERFGFKEIKKASELNNGKRIPLIFMEKA